MAEKEQNSNARPAAKAKSKAGKESFWSGVKKEWNKIIWVPANVCRSAMQGCANSTSSTVISAKKRFMFPPRNISETSIPDGSAARQGLRQNCPAYLLQGGGSCAML